MNTHKGKDIITRRAFFRQLYHKTIPFLALPSVSTLLLLSCERENDGAYEKETDGFDCKNGCESSCSKSCAGSCEGLCAVACGGSCALSCINISK